MTKLESFLAVAPVVSILPSEEEKRAFVARNVGRFVRVLLWRIASDGSREEFWDAGILTPRTVERVSARLIDFLE